MNVAHRITGYDKKTERLSFEHMIPVELDPLLRQLAHAPVSDPEMVGGYPLNEPAARSLSLRLDVPLNCEAYDWFIEPVAS